MESKMQDLIEGGILEQQDRNIHQMNWQQDKAILNDTIIGLRILLDHAASHCKCDECKEIRLKFSMDQNCSMETFKLPVIQK